MVASLAVLPGLAAACGGDERKAGSITIAETAQPDFLDPALSSTINATEAIWLVYTPLLTYRRAEGKAGTELIPGLAEELPDVSADGRAYRLRLRKGLRYSNGRAVRAADFERSVKRLLSMQSPASAFFLGIEGAEEYLARDRPEADISGIVTDDSSGSITIRLRAADATFPNVLATTYAGVVPSDTPFVNLTKRPAPGFGPYRIVRSTPGREFVLARTKDFDLPGIPAGNVERITVRIVTNPARQAQDVRRGRLDYMQDPPPADMLRTIKAEHPDRFREFVTPGTSFFFLNTREAPFDKLEVRRAVNYALDESALVRVMGGLLRSTCNVLPPSVPGYRELDPCPYGEPGSRGDIPRARRLIRAAGADGEHVKVWGPQQDPGPAITAYFVDLLNKIGLDAESTLVDFAVYFQTLGNRTTRAQTGFVTWLGDFPHPYSFLRQFSGPAITETRNVNLGNVRDSSIDSAMGRLNGESRVGKVEDDWGALDRRLVERAYLAVYGNPMRTTFMSERMDFEGCSRVHPVYGNDYSSFCLK